jgi:predicted amidophosphoribosyltransferase
MPNAQSLMPFFTPLVDFLFPAQCLQCNQPVAAHGTLCLPCWQHIRFITDPFCDCCGLPFDYTLGAGALCGDCLRERPIFAQARAVFCYDDHSKALILK